MTMVQNSKGVALTVVVIVLIMVALLTGYVASLGYNQRRVTDAASGRRVKVNYRAQAGMVDAMWRIRTDYRGVTDYTAAALTPAGTFTDPNFNPNPYLIDVDRDGANDVSVDIGTVQVNAVTGSNQRTINSTGLDV